MVEEDDILRRRIRLKEKRRKERQNERQKGENGMANSITIERDKKNKTEKKKKADTLKQTRKTCRRKDKQEEKDKVIYYPRTLVHASKQTKQTNKQS